MIPAVKLLGLNAERSTGDAEFGLWLVNILWFPCLFASSFEHVRLRVLRGLDLPSNDLDHHIKVPEAISTKSTGFVKEQV